eukprot:CAMPEP_0173207550 /NCGR_PEP_ID=MMETSP1141-20130122/21992_1 /TAXON_ID=483371 /ORGANISM="non described non described, Strain CCMP2298" /LENGTH=134 /DNA_ID=CAMNT_0014133841 /DNA_START=372 /DNA_END=776 /DNA_ORIENTATION=+
MGSTSSAWISSSSASKSSPIKYSPPVSVSDSPSLSWFRDFIHVENGLHGWLHKSALLNSTSTFPSSLSFPRMSALIFKVFKRISTLRSDDSHEVWHHRSRSESGEISSGGVLPLTLDDGVSGSKVILGGGILQW